MKSVSISNCAEELTRELIEKIVAAPWGRQPGSHGRVFKRRFSPTCGGWATRIEILIDGLCVFALYEGSDDKWRGERVPREVALAKHRTRRARNREQQARYDEARAACADFLQRGGSVEWVPGQEGGIFRWRESCVSARGVLRLCGLTTADIEAVTPRFDASRFRFALPKVAAVPRRALMSWKLAIQYDCEVV